MFFLLGELIELSVKLCILLVRAAVPLIAALVVALAGLLLMLFTATWAVLMWGGRGAVRLYERRAARRVVPTVAVDAFGHEIP